MAWLKTQEQNQYNGSTTRVVTYVWTMYVSKKAKKKILDDCETIISFGCVMSTATKLIRKSISSTFFGTYAKSLFLTDFEADYP